MLAILLIVIFLFNLVGYRVLLSCMEMQADVNLQARIDNNQLADQHLISIKTPLNLPYYSNSPEYENVSGSVELDGVEYKYVKRRVYNDSLELICYPNLSKKEIRDAKNEMFRLSTEAPFSEKSKKASVIKNLLPEFWEQVSLNNSYSKTINSKSFDLFQPAIIFSALLQVNEQPPETIS